MQFYWSEYSNKLREHILSPRNLGVFDGAAAARQHMHLAIGRLCQASAQVKISFLVDLEDGLVADAKFQAFGEGCLIGICDTICDLSVRKSHMQVRRISASLIDHHVRDFSDKAAFPAHADTLFNQVLDVVDSAMDSCQDIPILDPALASPPVDLEAGAASPYPGFELLSSAEKLQVIRNVVEKEIQPYVALDDGGVQILELKNQTEVVVSYTGACTSCFAAIGSTLEAIGHTLRLHVHPSLTVSPDMASLQLK